MTPERRIRLDTLSRGLDDPPDGTAALVGLGIALLTVVLYELFVSLPAAVSVATP